MFSQESNALSPNPTANNQPATVIHWLIDGIALIPILLISISSTLTHFVPPFQRIFRPDDPTISYPHADPETISNPVLFIISTIYPAFVIILWAWRSKFSIRQIIYIINVLLISITVTMVITNVMKISIGRLRPDFLDRCKPIEDPGTPGRWKCTGDPTFVNEGRVSFPSGHSSLSFAGGSFLVLFIHGSLPTPIRRNPWVRCLLILMIIPALFTAISRLFDYRHHPIDVFSGSLLGILFSLFWYRTFFIGDRSSERHGLLPKYDFVIPRCSNTFSSSSQL